MSVGKRLKIGIFLPRFSPYGGVERYGLGLSKALAAADCAVCFVCARQEIPPPEGVEVLTLGRFGGLRAIKQAWFALGAQRVMRGRRFDATIGLGKSWGHDLHRINQGPERIFMRLTERALDPGWPRTAKHWRRLASPETYIAMRAEERQLATSTRLVYVSDLVRDWCLEAYPWAAGKPSRVVYTRPDPERFTPVTPESRAAARHKLGLAGADVAMGFAATSYQRKGLGTAIKALARLPESHLLLVAGGKKPGPYQELARKAGVAGRVRFLGRVDDMTGLYHACDAAVLPSFYDTASNTVLEAVSCGIRTVASASDGSSAFVPVKSVVTDPADDMELATRITHTLEAPAWEPRRRWEETDSGYGPVVEDIIRLAADKRQQGV